MLMSGKYKVSTAQFLADKSMFNDRRKCMCVSLDENLATFYSFLWNAHYCVVCKIAIHKFDYLAFVSKKRRVCWIISYPVCRVLLNC